MSYRQNTLTERQLQHLKKLTEAGGAVGGVNDGDMPAIGTISATYTQSEIVSLRDAIREVAAQLNRLLEVNQR